jgi:hypothetical protein
MGKNNSKKFGNKKALIEEKEQMHTTVYKKKRKKKLSAAHFFLYSAEFVIVIGVLAAAGLFWSNPEILSRQINKFLNTDNPQQQSEKDIQIQNSIDNLTAQVNKLSAQNSYFLNIKADSSVVLGIVERLDLLEKRALKLSMISNDGALILSSVMMIKEAASIGQPFEYEAEILNHLSQDQISIQDEVKSIFSISGESLPSDIAIVNSFNDAYKKLLNKLKPSDDSPWQDKLSYKMKGYINIKLIKDGEEPEYNIVAALKTIQNYVESHDFVATTEELAKPENKPILDDQDISKWVAKAKNKLKFYRDISKIAAYSLSLMKAESVKNKAI